MEIVLLYYVIFPMFHYSMFYRMYKPWSVMRKYGKTLQIQVSMNDLIIYEWISPILFPVRSVSMLEIHGDTELSNMESFNLKETKNGDNRNWIKRNWQRVL